MDNEGEAANFEERRRGVAVSPAGGSATPKRGEGGPLNTLNLLSESINKAFAGSMGLPECDREK